MCETDEQNQIQSQQMDAYTQMQDMLKQQFGNQQEIFGQMTSLLSPIFAAGPNQKGFTDEQRNNLNSQVIEGTAENYQGAAKAVNENLAAKGGGMMPLTSGGEAQLKQSVANASAQEQSREEAGVVSDDYAAGLDKWKTAANGLTAVAAAEDPLGYASASTSSGTAAANTANQIASQKNSWINAVVGAAGSLGAGFATGGMKH